MSMCADHVQSTKPLLGRYRLVEVRDQGGFGNVLVAWDIRLQRRVAIKQIPLEEASTTFHEALAEARASSFLAHPNIISVHDFLSDDEYAYLVMEYVDGFSLAELLSRIEDGVLIYDEVAYVFSALSDALSFAHANGVLHLDIKPANILVDRAGNVKLADFGMATLMSAAGFGDARGGTLGYMPAEQVLGETVDERTDLFSLACVMYEALLGTAPFKANTDKQSLKALKHGAPDARDVEAEMPPETAEALSSALAYEPHARQTSIAEFSEAALPPLGDVAHGKRSLTELIASETDDFEPEAWAALDTFETRHPLATRILARLSGALPAISIATGIAVALTTAGITSLGVAIFAPIALALLALVLPSLASLFSLWLLASTLILLHPEPLFILAGALLAIAATAWAILCGAYQRFSTLAAFVPAVTWLPFWTPGGNALVWKDPARAAFSAALGSATAWALWALVSPQDALSIAISIVFAGTGAAAAAYHSEAHPYLAQVFAAAIAFFSLFLMWQRLNIVFAGTNCVFLVVSLVLMFALLKEFRRNGANTGD